MLAWDVVFSAVPARVEHVILADAAHFERYAAMWLVGEHGLKCSHHGAFQVFFVASRTAAKSSTPFASMLTSPALNTMVASSYGGLPSSSFASANRRSIIICSSLMLWAFVLV